MLVYFVRDALFSPHKKDTLAYDRLVSLLEEKEVDAVLIANDSNQFQREIDGFKQAYGSLVGKVVYREAPVRMADNLFHLRASSLVTPKNEVIQAVDDAVCEITVKDDGTYQYRYIVLDLFDSEHFDKVVERSAKHFVIPFQDIISFLEQNMDDDTAEMLKKVKADFYYKTKS